MSNRNMLSMAQLDTSAKPTPRPRDSYFSGSKGLPTSPRPGGRPISEYQWGSSSHNQQSSTVDWQSPLAQNPPSPESYSPASKRQSSRISYVPISYSASSYSPVFESPSSEQSADQQYQQYYEQKTKSSNSKRLSGMLSRFGSQKQKKKATKVREESEFVEVKAHNDWMDADW